MIRLGSSRVIPLFDDLLRLCEMRNPFARGDLDVVARNQEQLDRLLATSGSSELVLWNNMLRHAPHVVFVPLEL